MKEIDLRLSVYRLTEQHPQLIPVLKEMGFLGVANPLVRKTVGKKTTIIEGANKQGKDLGKVISKLKEKGFAVNPDSMP